MQWAAGLDIRWPLSCVRRAGSGEDGTQRDCQRATTRLGSLGSPKAASRVARGSLACVCLRLSANGQTATQHDPEPASISQHQAANCAAAALRYGCELRIDVLITRVRTFCLLGRLTQPSPGCPAGPVASTLFLFQFHPSASGLASFFVSWPPFPGIITPRECLVVPACACTSTSTGRARSVLYNPAWPSFALLSSLPYRHTTNSPRHSTTPFLQPDHPRGHPRDRNLSYLYHPPQHNTTHYRHHGQEAQVLIRGVQVGRPAHRRRLRVLPRALLQQPPSIRGPQVPEPRRRKFAPSAVPVVARRPRRGASGGHPG